MQASKRNYPLTTFDKSLIIIGENTVLHKKQLIK